MSADRLKPWCNQCSSIHFERPGYCDPLEQNFRDESESVVKRAQKTYKTMNGSCKKKISKCSGDAVDLASTITTWVPMYDGLAPASGTELPTPVCIAQPLDDNAVSHFMLSYIPGIHFEYLTLMYGRSAKSKALPAIVYATSVATLAWNTGQAGLMDKARCYYVRALLRTNAAFADPLTASQDSTLVSVLLLSLFEAIEWSDPVYRIVGRHKRCTCADQAARAAIV